MIKSQLNGRPVYVVDGSRTPFLKAKNGQGPFSAADLAVQTGKQLLMRLPIDSTVIDEVVIGCAMPSPDEVNIARVIALRLGCGKKVPAWTVMRNCASGMQALDNAAQSISHGRAELVLAGGTDAMSHAPLLFNAKMANWLMGWFSARSVTQRAQLVTKLKPAFFAPVIALLRGLTDPIVGMNMGQTAENIAYRFELERTDLDAFAVSSHKKLAAAMNDLAEITPLIDNSGNVYSTDTGARADSSIEKLAKLKPMFDKKFGMVTAGNSSQITDGACLLMLASEDAVKKYHLPVLGCIKDVEWSALDPAMMGLGPVHASTALLQRQGKALSDIDYWEINEAFAAQVLGCVEAFQDEAYCQDVLALKGAFGELPMDKLNVDGGAIACGHPIGASGARIVLHLLHVLKNKQAKSGIASICIGGGQGGAMLVERVEGERQ